MIRFPPDPTLVLSEAYFKSEYCMYELCRIHENRNFAKRVNPIVLTGTQFRKPTDQLRYIKHWQAETANLEAELAGLTDPKYTRKLREDLDGSAENRRLMDTLLNVLADMNTLTEGVHLGTDFSALLDRIQPDQFRSTIIAEVGSILDRNSRLCEALQRELHVPVATRAPDLAATLCAGDADQVLSKLLFPATRKCLAMLDGQQAEFTNAWRAAKSVLAWLSLLAVDVKSLVQAQRSTLVAGDVGFQIAVSTPLGVEIVSSRYQEMRPRLRIQKGKSDVFGDDVIALPEYETGWGNDASLDKLLLEIWTRVFPEEESVVKLSNADLKKLNATLRVRHELKTHHHYIPVPADQQARLGGPAFYGKLIEKLPNINVIFFNSDDDTPALLVSDEYYLMTIIREFLTIPELLGKKP